MTTNRPNTVVSTTYSLPATSIQHVTTKLTDDGFYAAHLAILGTSVAGVFGYADESGAVRALVELLHTMTTGVASIGDAIERRAMPRPIAPVVVEGGSKRKRNKERRRAAVASMEDAIKSARRGAGRDS
jgi:hypothetical protein